MSEMKHTRGPWEVRFAGNGYPYSIEAPKGNRGPGGITSVTRWGAISFPSSQEGLANARLIAAAPELLEALNPFSSLIDVLELMGGNTPRTGNYLSVAAKGKEASITIEDLKAARAAIAKATGAPQ